MLVDDVSEVTRKAPKSALETVRMMREKTQVPVPEVYNFDTGNDNPLSAPYIVMSYQSGRQICDAWYEDRKHGGNVRMNILESVARAMAHLSSMHFDTIGSTIDGAQTLPRGLGCDRYPGFILMDFNPMYGALGYGDPTAEWEDYPKRPANFWLKYKARAPNWTQQVPNIELPYGMRYSNQALATSSVPALPDI
ncbi:hypothetical protein BGZ61DRAFT_526143 [Ilyonectria robusta]|uniref:uncharacterized protein n=1 Tax=Ilyonectria robusta TaxID=1079257 RepID=UPI001E8CCE4E|nr:uncharacterized protein BGZ61DRAFT_526143 [Ilyonectria robusta]KAH8738144.1 hypothetical protein BGZ61DRAFT_526143 [Ilyonectria robusta]